MSKPTVQKGAIVAILAVGVAVIVLVTMAILIVGNIEAERAEHAQETVTEEGEGWGFGDVWSGITGFFSELFAPGSGSTPMPTMTTPIPPELLPTPPWRAPTPVPTPTPDPPTAEVFTEGLPTWRIDGAAVHGDRIYYTYTEPGIGVWVGHIAPDGTVGQEIFIPALTFGPRDIVVGFDVADDGSFLFLVRMLQQSQSAHGEFINLAFHRYNPASGVYLHDLLEFTLYNPDAFRIIRTLFTDDGLMLAIHGQHEIALDLFGDDLMRRGTLFPRFTQLVQTPDGRLFNVEFAGTSDPTVYRLRAIDFAAGDWGNDVFPFLTQNVHFVRSAHAGAPFDLYFDVYQSGVLYFYGYTLATEESALLHRWPLTDDDITSVGDWPVGRARVFHWPDGRISILYARHATDDEPGYWHVSLTTLKEATP